jgi:hypothetical protein
VPDKKQEEAAIGKKKQEEKAKKGPFSKERKEDKPEALRLEKGVTRLVLKSLNPWEKSER